MTLVRLSPVQRPGRVHVWPMRQSWRAARAPSDALVEITACMAGCANARQDPQPGPRPIRGRDRRDNTHIAIRAGERWDLQYAYQNALDPRDMSESDAPAFEWVERTRQVLVVDDTNAMGLDNPLRLEPHHVKSYACIPLLAGDRLLGVLSFVNYSAAAAFYPSEVEFLDRLAKLVALALQNVQLHQTEARQQAELAQQVEELQALIDLVPFGISIAHDPECKQITINPAGSKMLALPLQANVSLVAPEHERAANFRMYADGRELPADERPMQQAARGLEVRNRLLDIVRADGQTITLLASAVPLVDAAGRPRCHGSLRGPDGAAPGSGRGGGGTPDARSAPGVHSRRHHHRRRARRQDPLREPLWGRVGGRAALGDDRRRRRGGMGRTRPMA